MVNEEKIKRHIIKKANIKSIEDTEKLIKKYLDKMNYSKLKTTENYVLNRITDGKGDTIANNLFLILVQEKLKKYEKQ